MATLEKLLGKVTSVCIQAAVALGIPEQLAEGPKSIDMLARDVHADRDVLHLFMRALTSQSLFQEIKMGVFTHTDLSRCLQGPDSLRGIATMLTDDWARRVWEPEELLHTLRTGEPAFEHAFGENFWDYMSAHPDQYASFTRSQAIFSGPLDEAIVDAYDFSGIGTLVDVGGGEGGFLVKALAKYPDLRGVLFDLPPVAEAAQRLVAASGVGDRCSCVAGSFFDKVPAGGDAYVLKQVMHDWDDDHSVEILRNCRAAMAPGGRILICGYSVPEPPARPLQYLLAGLWVRLNCAGGYERTEGQFREVFAQAGLELVRVLPTASIHSVFETRAA